MLKYVLECDKNDQLLMTWTYPTITDTNNKYLLNKIRKLQKSNFVFLRNKKSWIYVTNNDVSEADSNLSKSIKRFSLVIIANDCNPNKYEALGRILSRCYCKTGNPVELVKPYLSVYTTGACSTQENGAFLMKDFDNNRNSSIKIKGITICSRTGPECRDLLL